jgi:RimJ/RimL family protein N-acetyltransferase
MSWPAAEPIETARLALEPLRVGHAAEMLRVLADPDLYEYTGGDPPSLDQLRSRYAGQAAGQSPDGEQGWLNWIMRHRKNQHVLGTVQTTLFRGEEGLSGELAWIVDAAHQRRGYATEAATAILGWLRARGVEVIFANIHPDHEGSAAVARRIGLVATDAIVKGETRWRSNRE